MEEKEGGGEEEGGVDISPRWRINFGDLVVDFSRPLGRGAYGTVWKGEYLGSPVALKQLALGGYGAEDEFLKYLKREVDSLANIRHPNIVQFLGVSTHLVVANDKNKNITTRQEIYLVTEFLEGGDLSKVKDPAYSANWKLRLTILSHIARAMNHIHSRGNNHLFIYFYFYFLN